MCYDLDVGDLALLWFSIEDIVKDSYRPEAWVSKLPRHDMARVGASVHRRSIFMDGKYFYVN
jgi:hypothetical protein